MSIADVLLSLPKTVLFNLKYFGIKGAVQLPVIVSRRTRLKTMGGKIILENPKRFGVRIGFGDVTVFDKKNSWSVWQVKGTVIFKGDARIGHGSKISVNSNGRLEFGDNLLITAESSIVCSKEIVFGNDVLMAWDNLIMDTDFHDIVDATTNSKINDDEKVKIGDHVWIGSRCTILKGSHIPNDTVLAANSVTAKKFNETNTVIAGNPAKVVKQNINWIK